jgi:hypothetical protein
MDRKIGGIRLEATLKGMASQIPGFALRELNSDLGLAALGENDGYFYAEVPTRGTDYKRFLYKADDDDGNSISQSKSPMVPLQFGREVVATVMENPEKGHWKACVMDAKREEEVTTSFRESLAEFNSSE